MPVAAQHLVKYDRQGDHYGESFFVIASRCCRSESRSAKTAGETGQLSAS